MRAGLKNLPPKPLGRLLPTVVPTEMVGKGILPCNNYLRSCPPPRPVRDQSGRPELAPRVHDGGCFRCPQATLRSANSWSSNARRCSPSPPPSKTTHGTNLYMCRLATGQEELASTMNIYLCP